jgi:hypothetical protein
VPIQWLELREPALAGICNISFIFKRLTRGSYRADKGFGGLAAGRADPRQAADLAEGITEGLDTGDNGGLVLCIVEVWRLGDNRPQLVVNGEATAGDGAGAEVLGQGHGG